MTDLNTLKNWFKTGLKPSQEQFWAWMDSFYHKNDKIPQDKIQGLDKSLENKAETSALDTKANADASGLDDENLLRWKETLGVWDLPDNLVYSNPDKRNKVLMGDGTTREVGDLGRNIYNSDGALEDSRTINMAGYFLIYQNLSNQSRNSAFNEVLSVDAQGRIARSNTKPSFLNLPNILTPQEKDVWLAKMNSQTSFSGTSISFVSPPILLKSDKPQYIMINGLGLNLVTNFDSTPENNKSYVGLWHDANENGIQEPNELDIPAQNYSVKGDNKIITAQVLINPDQPTGKYKVKVKNAGIPALGDISIRVVDEIITIPLVEGVINLVSGTSTKNYIRGDTVKLSPDENIKALNPNPNNFHLNDPVSYWKDGNILKGSEDWYVRIILSSETTAKYGERYFYGKFGLTSLSDTNIHPEPNIGTTDIKIFALDRGGDNPPFMYELQTKTVSVEYIKEGNMLSVIATDIINNRVRANIIPISTLVDYCLCAVANNSKTDAGIIIQKQFISKI